MLPSSEQLVKTILPCVKLFADAWGVSVPVAHDMCQQGASLVVDKLFVYHKPYRFHRNVSKILKNPINRESLALLKQYAVPLDFFDKQELTDWQETYPTHRPKDTLCLLGLILLWNAKHNLPIWQIGLPVSSNKPRHLAFEQLSHEQKAWACVAVFLAVLAIMIWQSLPEPPPKPIAPPKIHQKIPDVAIIRIDDDEN